MRVGQTRRRDRVEPAIVQALRHVGADVTRVSGPGALDLVIRFRGQVFGVEVKSGAGKRTKAQESSGWPVVRTPADALGVIGAEPQ